MQKYVLFTRVSDTFGPPYASEVATSHVFWSISSFKGVAYKSASLSDNEGLQIGHRREEIQRTSPLRNQYTSTKVGQYIAFSPHALGGNSRRRRGCEVRSINLEVWEDVHNEEPAIKRPIRIRRESTLENSIRKFPRKIWPLRRSNRSVGGGSCGCLSLLSGLPINHRCNATASLQLVMSFDLD